MLSDISIAQTMNKVFEHAGDLVNIKVAHNLIRLIAEGFGEDDDAADSQLRSSAVCYFDNFNGHMICILQSVLVLTHVAEWGLFSGCRFSHICALLGSQSCRLYFFKYFLPNMFYFGERELLSLC